MLDLQVFEVDVAAQRERPHVLDPDGGNYAADVPDLRAGDGVVEFEVANLDRARPELRRERADLGADVVLGERAYDLARDDAVYAPAAVEHEEDEGQRDDRRDGDQTCPHRVAAVDDATPAATPRGGGTAALVRRRRCRVVRQFGCRLSGSLVVFVSGHSSVS